MASQELNTVIVHCKGLIFDAAGRLLLVRQAESIGTHWNPPGGRIEEGDSLENCLRREVREETGLIVESSRLVYPHAFLSPGYSDVYMGFHVTEYSGTLGAGTSLTETEEQEITHARFVAQGEPLADPLFPAALQEMAEACLRGEAAEVKYLGTESLADYA